jgi:hypothetical protein
MSTATQIGWRTQWLGRLARKVDLASLRLRESNTDYSERLCELDLYGSTVADLAPLSRFACLERLTVSSSRTVRDLAPVAGLARLRELRISQGGPVNLAGFAGVCNLTIKVEGATRVIGADKLGPGSLIERWDGK